MKNISGIKNCGFCYVSSGSGPSEGSCVPWVKNDDNGDDEAIMGRYYIQDSSHNVQYYPC